MASKGIEKLVSEACKKGYSVFRKGDRIEICKPNRKWCVWLFYLMVRDTGEMLI